MIQDIRKVNDLESLMTYFSEKLGWAIDPDDYYDIDDITYDFEAEDLGLKEEAFAKITSLKQLQPLVDNQRWGIFFVNFESDRFEKSALRKILSGLVPAKRNADHAVWNKSDLLFLCTWGKQNNLTIGAAYFEDSENGLPQIKMISCEPAVEDFTQINVFEQRLTKLAWPKNPNDTEAWHEAWSSAFTTRYQQTIQDSHTLTVRLAEEAQHIRDSILNILEIETQNGYVHLLFEKFKNTLIHDMTEQQFADMYAQTVVYGLFSARCMDKSQDNFSASEAVECIPNTNPFLKSLMQECLGSNNIKSKLSFDELEISNIVDLLLHTRTDSIIEDFNRQTGGGREDPVIHFYEEFLTEYDKTQKVQRGVYYTPQPVVNFIVRAVDDILKTEFGIADGLASTETKRIKYMRESKRRVGGLFRTQVADEMDVPAIQVLDPATGTGTFLRQTILQIYHNFCESYKEQPTEKVQAEWNAYVPEHLLKRLNGFELMMAPYAVAHMKLAMVLKDTGYKFDSNERLQVYLTNSLEEPGNSDQQFSLWDDPLAFESVAANGIKKNNGINIVIGNPPYAGESSNKGEWILGLLEDYKFEPGGEIKLQERNSKWINDDYVKFIRLAQTFVDATPRGMIAYINPHGFSDNPTFRGMRWNLLQSFNKIYVLDLHGNSKKKETSPDGSKDENVFDIQQGVCIFIAIKLNDRKNKDCEVFHADLYGVRQEKYDYLSSTFWKNVHWEKVSYNEPFYFFKPMTENNRDVYEDGFSINDLFLTTSIGVVSARDDVVVDFTYQELRDKIDLFCNPEYTDEMVRSLFWPNKQPGKYLPGDTRGWSLSKARKAILQNEHDKYIERFLYRPFDWRYIYYTKTMVDWSREQVMRNFIGHDNRALIAPRQTKERIDCYLTECVCGHKTCSSYDVNTIFPLYIYSEKFGHSIRKPNFSDDIIHEFEHRLNCTFKDTDANDSQDIFTANDIFDYIFATMNSTVYKDTYSEFLKIDFPKIPYPENIDYFRQLANIGHSLEEIELLKFDLPDDVFLFNQTATTAIVEKARHKADTVIINKAGDTFEGIDKELWDKYVGGYKPLQKWLQDRKGRTLTQEDILLYRKIAYALKKRDEIIPVIDSIIQL